MFYKYFRFTKKRIVVFTIFWLFVFFLQWLLTGSIISRQQVTTQAGTESSSVVSVIDDAEIIRQKFKFDRQVVLSRFTINFASFEHEKVGKTLNIQMTDADNSVVYSADIPVSEITPNQPYTVNMDYTVTIPRGVICCLRLTSSSDNELYSVVPAVNTTNRTNPNTILSTLKMQTKKSALNISYTYTYRQIYPLFVLILEFLASFILCFEHVSDLSLLFRKRLWKAKKRDKRIAKKKKRSYSIKDIVKWCIAEPKFIKGVRIAAMAINPLILMFLLEAMNNTLSVIHIKVWFFTWVLLFGIQLFFFAVSGNMYLSIIFADLILFACGMANRFLMDVRGTPFLPADFFGVTTATEVVDHYTLSLTPAQFIVIPAILLWFLFVYRIKPAKVKRTRMEKVRRRLVPAVCSLVLIGLLYNTSILEACGIEDNVWNKVLSSQTNGFYMNYFLNLHYLRVSMPSGYSQEAVEKILDDALKGNDTVVNNVMPKPDENNNKNGDNENDNIKYLSNKDFAVNTSLNGKKPNIIYIMNESLADFAAIGKTNFSSDPLSFMHGMKENTIKGLDYVSVFGAGTSNSEFEALTGNSMKFFPSGCNVYQQFMHESTFSMPSYLKELGYECDAIHPSTAANWNRINTYNSMKFDRFISIDDFNNPEYVRYVSDKASYKKVIELFEKRKDDKPLFIFDVTIQNHGGYLTNTNWKEPVTVNGSHFTETNEFLSSIKVSDDAFKYLVNYFEKVDEPTIICMFGDHQPSVETKFYEELLGKKQDEWELTDVQKRYATPFVLWANYDIPEADNVLLGNNYLENMILKQAGLNLPVYNSFIEEVSKALPVMNVNGYMDYDGKWHNYDDETSGEISNILNSYELVQYGYYSDTDKDKMSEIFKMAH